MTTPEATDRPEETRAKHWEITGGFLLIGAGVVFLLRNFGVHVPLPRNWWAIFIAIGAVVNLGRAWQLYRRERRLSSRGAGLLIGGLATSIIAVILLLDLPWDKVWPVWLIFAGVSALLGKRRRK